MRMCLRQWRGVVTFEITVVIMEEAILGTAVVVNFEVMEVGAI